MNRRPNITMIDELPDIDEIVDYQGPMGSGPQGSQGPQGIPDDRLQKFIRPPHKIAPDAGMAPYAAPPPKIFNMPFRQQEMPPMEVATGPAPVPTSALSCIDVANHIKDCPICSKFYKHDNSIYIIVIILLAIMCILLLKRVLNV